jgi:hypothetical protein
VVGSEKFNFLAPARLPGSDGNWLLALDDPQTPEERRAPIQLQLFAKRLTISNGPLGLLACESRWDVMTKGILGHSFSPDSSTKAKIF